MSFTMISIVRNLLQIPDQANGVSHSIARYNEIADMLNTDRLIPSAMAVITLAKVICVHFPPPFFAIS